MTRGYRRWFQDLINLWTLPATMLKNKVMYRQFIHSVAFVNEKCCTCSRPLYLYFPDTPHNLAKRFFYTCSDRLVVIKHDDKNLPQAGQNRQ
jgi:hypothetical protein